MAKVTVAAMQFACGENSSNNVATAERMVRLAAQKGAQIILLPELFETPYFCKDQKQALFALAKPVDDHPMIRHFQTVAAALKVVLPISFFERSNNAYFNSVVMIDADGELLGLYRKSHIPDGPGYQEKFYFNPGDTGFKVWHTAYGRVGVGICWDQWFPELARSLALQGADMILYPTAIGNEPQDTTIDSKDHWQRTMQGHAGANIIPVIASNRIGVEKGDHFQMTFYGSSFIADQTGAKITEADRVSEAVITASFDLEKIRLQRASWGLFRDRRPELYTRLLSYDGQDSML
ncbi:MAG: N-carbamoylputrescine amidase [Alphaproteobacteria bacterium]|nr:N-carbamoylputrescine amidase [Alphaproteobacteria bacterium]